MNSTSTKPRFKIDFENLPVYSQKERILEALTHNQVIVVESNTGSGKTTQIPVILYEAGYISEHSKIGMTQPRRIAAFSVADTLLQQLRFQYPDLPEDFVQYKIRFEDKTTANTKIKIMTDGILLQEIKHDMLLSSYSVLVIDEAHERSLNIDFILGLLKNICAQRSDLKVIISSATINSKIFSDYFLYKCPVISIEAPIFPIELRYKEVAQATPKHTPRKKHVRPARGRQQQEELEELVVKVVKESLKRKEGDILIFLSGEKAIKNCLDKLSQLRNAQSLHLLPLYGRLDHKAQEEVFKTTPVGKTKIIAATNIAETSITIDNISVVIDSGRVKLNYFHYQKLSSTLTERAISKASAIQRKGRAGRTKPGICYRLYSEEDYQKMEDYTQEEILRTDLSEIILRMAHLGIKDFEYFEFLSAPSKTAILSAVALLQDMDALDSERAITDTGLLMISFPLSPVHSRILVEAMKYYPDIISKLLMIISFLTTPSPFLLPINEEMKARSMHHKFLTNNSDFFSFVKLFEIYADTAYEDKPQFCITHYLDLKCMNEIVNVHQQLSEMVRAQGIFVGEKNFEDQIVKSILKGLAHNVCLQFRGSTYLSRSGEKIYIHPGSMIFDSTQYPSIVIAGEVVQTSKLFARSLTWTKLEWFKDTWPFLHNELKQLISLISSRSFLNRQKLKAKLGSHNPLFLLTPHSSLRHVDDTPVPKTRDNSNKITISGIEYTLAFRSDNTHKVLRLSWSQMRSIMSTISPSEIVQYAKLRCDIAYNPHAVLRNIKLANLPIFCKLYREKPIFTPHILSMMSITKLKRRSHIDSALHLLNASMQILIPAHTKHEGKNTRKFKTQDKEYKYLSLHINDSHEIYLQPEGSFISALQDSLHTLGIIRDMGDNKIIVLPKVFLQRLDDIYTHFRRSYESGILVSTQEIYPSP